uniref:THAP-type domain-containing protein n=1 Tax=Periophthalmus magnuspinnatus TaxID=409849 RepID=A0A3B4BEN9_9GOBI
MIIAVTMDTISVFVTSSPSSLHSFPMDSPSLLARWLKAAGRPHWYPHLWSSVCSVHFTDDCFDGSGGREVLKPDAVDFSLYFDLSSVCVSGAEGSPEAPKASSNLT